MRQGTWRRVVAVLLLGVLVLAGCGDDEDEDAEASTDTTEAASTETTAAPAEPSGDSAVPEETGPADDSLEPITIGWINNDDGPVSFPGSTAGFKAGLAYINDKLGGIDGHPVEGAFCSAGLDQDSVRQCAQQLANDDSVDIIASGFVVVSDPLFPVLKQAGKPILFGTPLNLPDWTNPDVAVSYFPGNPGISAGAPVFTVDFADAKKIAVVVSDNDAGRSAMALVEAVLANDDVEIAKVFVSDDEVDYTGPIQAAGADTADAFVPLVAQNGCIQVANALDTLGLDVPVATTALCGDKSVIEAAGSKIVGWTLGFNGPPTLLPAGSDPEVDHYNEVYPEYGDAAMKDAAGATGGFGEALALWSVGNTVGADELDSASWLTGIKAFTGPVYLGPRSLACGANDTFPGLCSTQSRWFTIGASGLEDATDGAFVDPFNR